MTPSSSSEHESNANTNTNKWYLCTPCHLYSTQEERARERHTSRTVSLSLFLWPLHRQNEEERQQITLKSAAVVPQPINASLPPGHVNTEEWWPFAIWLPFLFSLPRSPFSSPLSIPPPTARSALISTAGRNKRGIVSLTESSTVSQLSSLFPRFISSAVDHCLY